MLLFQSEQQLVDRYEEYARLALRSAYRLGSRRRMSETLIHMALFEDKLGNEARRDEFSELWDKLESGGSVDLVVERFGWVKQPSSTNLGMADEGEGGRRIIFDLAFVQEIREVILRTGVEVASDSR
jgi:hypothetical protein